MIKVLIVDDELLVWVCILWLLLEYSNYIVIGDVCNGE